MNTIIPDTLRSDDHPSIRRKTNAENMQSYNSSVTELRSANDAHFGPFIWTSTSTDTNDNVPPAREIFMDRQNSASSSISLNSWGSDFAEDQLLDHHLNFRGHVVLEPKICNDKCYVLPSPCDSFEMLRRLPISHQQKEWSDLILMMKERFAKLLLGDDITGGAKGGSTALTISNAITKLADSVFKDITRLEPLSPEKQLKWQREMEWLISPCEYIVELVPSAQALPDGSTMEVMISKPRSDLYIGLPALQKLDAMLLETLESFRDTEFWYADSVCQEDSACEMGCAFSERDMWTPIAKVPSCGLSEDAMKQLSHQKEAAIQILKAAKSINEHVSSEMEIPESYWKCLPRSSKKILGDTPLRIITSEFCCFETLLSTVDRPSRKSLSALANRLEALVHVWKLKIDYRLRQALHCEANACRSTSNWGMGRDLSLRKVERKQKYMERAESLLTELRQRFPGLLQTSLELSKIQHNKDVGFAVLESYSRVLANLAATIQTRISEVINADKDGMLSRIQSYKSNQIMGKAALQAPLTSPGVPNATLDHDQISSCSVTPQDNLMQLGSRLQRVLGNLSG